MRKPDIIYIISGILFSFTLLYGQAGGTSAYFDGSSDYLTPGDHYHYETSATFELWVYRNPWNAPSHTEVLFSTSEIGGYSLSLRTDNTLRFKVRDGPNHDYVSISYSCDDLADGWHHFAAKVSFNYPQSMNLYVDGNYVADAGESPDIHGWYLYDDNWFIIGGEAGSGSTPESGYYFTGWIDEFRIWNGFLYSSPIQDWMHQPIISSHAPAWIGYLDGYYKLDHDWGGAGGWLDDASDNVGNDDSDNDLTNHNAYNSSMHAAPLVDLINAYTYDVRALWSAAKTDWSLESAGLKMLTPNVNNISGDDFIAFGHNDSTGITTADLPTELDKRTACIWQIADYAEDSLNIRISLYGCGAEDMLTSSFSAENYLLLKRNASSGNFTVVDTADDTNFSYHIVRFNDFRGFLGGDGGGYYSIGFKGRPPRVYTMYVQTTHATSVTVEGRTSWDGESPLTGMGTCWSTSPDPTLADNYTSETPGERTFFSTLTNLLPNTYYFYRAYATNKHGTSYGISRGFSTTPTSTQPPLSNGIYQVSTLEHLYWIADNDPRWSFDYVLTADIDASATNTWFPDENGNKAGWLPVGNSDTKFTGSFAGQNHTIDYLFLNRNTTNYIGLFGSLSNATVRNLELTNVDISGASRCGGLSGDVYNTTLDSCAVTGSINSSSYSGGLAGIISSSQVSNSYSTATVSASFGSAGGFAAYIYRSTLNNCYATGNSSGSSSIGGFAGYLNKNVTVTNCYATGDISGSSVIGGFAGYLKDNSTVTNCYATGNPTGTEYIGGFVGYNRESTVEHSYSTGSVTGNTYSGGFAGYKYPFYTTFTSCFWDTLASGTATGLGYGSSSEIQGEATPKMKDYNTFTAAGWDFVSETANGTDDYWDADQTGTVNNGYIILSMQSGADNSLPVELVFFRAECGHGKVMLRWETQSETENMGFVLESRLSGENTWHLLDDFTTSDLLEGQGSTVAAHDYQYIDTKAASGFTYEYRLSDVDYSESVNRHPVIRITVPEDSPHLLPGQFALEKMYPNPFNSNLTIRYETGEATQVQIAVFDLQGRRLKTLTDSRQSGFHELIWQTDDLPSGMYLVQIRSQVGSLLRKVTLLK